MTVGQSRRKGRRRHSKQNPQIQTTAINLQIPAVAPMLVRLCDIALGGRQESTILRSLKVTRNERTIRGMQMEGRLDTKSSFGCKTATRLVRCEFAFCLQPIFQFMARLSPALQINLVCAISYCLLV